MRSDVTVAIPWRPTPERMPAYNHVRQFWSSNGFHNIVLADSDPDKPFHRAQARNRAVAATTTHKVILADADTITDIRAVHTALNELDTQPAIIYPHNRYRLLDSKHIGAHDYTKPRPDHQLENAVGGIIVTTRDLYHQLGGMDERFDSAWGYEDAAFALAARTLTITERVDGLLISFNHPVDRDMTDRNPNKHRYRLYEMCNGDPELMRELVKR